MTETTDLAALREEAEAANVPDLQLETFVAREVMACFAEIDRLRLALAQADTRVRELESLKNEWGIEAQKGWDKCRETERALAQATRPCSKSDLQDLVVSLSGLNTQTGDDAAAAIERLSAETEHLRTDLDDYRNAAADRMIALEAALAQAEAGNKGVREAAYEFGFRQGRDWSAKIAEKVLIRGYEAGEQIRALKPEPGSLAIYLDTLSASPRDGLSKED